MNRFNYLPNHRYYDNTDGVILDSNGKALRGYSISGENVGDYDEESGKYIIPIQVSRKNLFDENVLLKLGDKVSVNDSEWIISNNEGVINNQIIFKDNTRYTLSFTAKQTAGNPRLQFAYTDGTYSNIGTWSPNTEYTSYIGTSTANKTVTHIRITYGGSGYMYILRNSMYLIEGVYKEETMPDYEQGYAKTYKIYLDEPLNGVLNSTIDKSLPVIGTQKGYNNILVTTNNLPTATKWQYYK